MNGINEHSYCYSGLELFLKNNREEIKKKEIKIFLLDSFNIALKLVIFLMISGIALTKYINHFDIPGLPKNIHT